MIYKTKPNKYLVLYYKTTSHLTGWFLTLSYVLYLIRGVSCNFAKIKPSRHGFYRLFWVQFSKG